MPLFTETMKYSRSSHEKDCLSQAIHAASIVAGSVCGLNSLHPL
jgi:hypothetical protein